MADNEDNGEGGYLREGPAIRPENLNHSARLHADDEIPPSVSEEERTQIKSELQKGLLNNQNKNSDDRVSLSIDRFVSIVFTLPCPSL